MRADTLLLTDTRMAACFRALGFRYRREVIIHERTDLARTQFLFELTSLRFPALNAQTLHKQWKSGELKKQDPLHVLCVMMLAQWNYDRLLEMQKGSRMRLGSVAGGCLTQYVSGEEQAGLTLHGAPVPCEDLRLAAAVSLVGIPTIAITGPPGARTYGLAATGYAVRLATGQMHLHTAQELIKRDPTKEDPLRLALEVTQPLHPVCIAYDALYNRSELKKELKHGEALLMIDEPGHRLNGSGESREVLGVKHALISVNAKGHVMDHATRHLKSPPIDWRP